MKLFRNCMFVVALCVSFATAAKADPFNTISFDYQLTSTDKTQLGRPSRNSIPQTYAMNEAYPGQINTTSTYYYQTFTFAASLFAGAPYIDISTYDPQNALSYFVSAYQNSYDPTYNSATDDHRQTTWLGDQGFSGNYQTNDGGSFSLTLPPGSDLVLVLNSTLPNGALPGYAFTVNIQGFGDTNYGDPIQPSSVTPEPSSLLLVATGVFGAVGAVRRRLA